MLDQEIETLKDGRFNDDPLTEAALRFTIGQVYARLYQMPRAEEQLRRAYDIRTRLLPDHRDTLATLVALISALPTGPERDALLEHALDAVPHVLAPDDRIALSLKLVHADVLVSKFQEEQALDLLRELLVTQQRVLPRGDPQTLHTRERMAFVLRNLKQVPQALELARETAELAADEHGEDDVTTHLMRKQLVRIIPRDEITEDDLRTIQSSVEGLRLHFGDDHDLTLDARLGLVSTLMSLQRFEAAEQAARAALAHATRLWGDRGEIPWRARALLWRILDRTDQREGAERIARDCERLLELALTSHEPEGPLMFMTARFDAYKLDRGQEALAVARQALALLDAYPHRAEAAGAINAWRDNLVYILSELKQCPEAELVARKQIDDLRRERGPTHRDTLRALNGLAWTLFLAERYDEAEPLAREAVEGFRVAKNPDILDRINTIDTLAMTLCQLHRPGEAEPLFREIFELFARGKSAGFFDGDAGLHALHHGQCLLMLERYAQAEARLLEALNAADPVPGKQPKNTANAARKGLVELYEKIGMPEKASLYRSGIEEEQSP